MIPTLVILATLTAAFIVTLRVGVAATFTYVLLPSLLLVFTVRPLEIPGLPDITTLAGVGYGTVLAFLLKGGEPLRFRFHLVDAAMIALSVVAIVSSMMAEQLWTGVSTAGQEFFEWLVPYFMARIAFTYRHYRLRAAQLLAGLAMMLGVVALYEMRIDPYFFTRKILAPFGLTSTNWVMVLGRFGLFRAQASFSHPIDLGNGGALLACIISVLACTSGRTLKTPWVALGVGSSLIMTLASLSFTSFVAAAAIGAIFITARLSRLTGYLLLPLSIVVIISYAVFTAHLVNTPPELPERPDQAFNSSYHMRHVIIQTVWPEVTRAGLWGYGITWDINTTGLESLDNAYLLFILRQGWLYLFAFLFLLSIVNIYGGMAVLSVRDGTARVPVAAGVAGLVGTMLGMYTVFFGFIYSRLFIILLGLTVTMCQQVFIRAAGRLPDYEADDAAQASAPPPQRRGAFARRQVRLAAR